jgi:hypothetical protein
MVNPRQPWEVQRVEAVSVEVVQHVTDPVGLVKVTSAIFGTGMPWALGNAICARRQSPPTRWSGAGSAAAAGLPRC